MSVSTIDLSPVQRAVVRDCLLQEFRDMGKAIVNEDVQYEPITQGDLIDARWKVERMLTLIGLLEDLGFIKPRCEGSGYAGSLASDFGQFDEAEVTS